MLSIKEYQSLYFSHLSLRSVERIVNNKEKSLPPGHKRVKIGTRYFIDICCKIEQSDLYMQKLIEFNSYKVRNLESLTKFCIENDLSIATFKKLTLI